MSLQRMAACEQRNPAEQEACWQALFGDDWNVSAKTVRKYLDYLNKHLTLPCEASANARFPWGTEYALYSDKQEHQGLEKGRLSSTDKLFIEKLVYDQSTGGIGAEVKRGEEKFDVALDWIEATDQNSPNYVLLDDYAFWLGNYS